MLTLDYLLMKRILARFTKSLIRRCLVAMLIFVSMSYTQSAYANITVAEYMTLRAEAKTGDKGAELLHHWFDGWHTGIAGPSSFGGCAVTFLYAEYAANIA